MAIELADAVVEVECGQGQCATVAVWFAHNISTPAINANALSVLIDSIKDFLSCIAFQERK